MTKAPSCYGLYVDAAQCFGCELESRCLQAAYLAEQRRANRHRQRRNGELGPAARHLVRLGYPVRVAVEADF